MLGANMGWLKSPTQPLGAHEVSSHQGCGCVFELSVGRVHGETSGTYFPDPPLVHPTVWTTASIQYYNGTHTGGGFTDNL